MARSESTGRCRMATVIGGLALRDDEDELRQDGRRSPRCSSDPESRARTWTDHGQQAIWSSMVIPGEIVKTCGFAYYF